MRDLVIDDYRACTTASTDIKDRWLRDFFNEELDRDRHWPEPCNWLNPTFEPGGRVDQLVGTGL